MVARAVAEDVAAQLKRAVEEVAPADQVETAEMRKVLQRFADEVAAVVTEQEERTEKRLAEAIEEARKVSSRCLEASIHASSQSSVINLSPNHKSHSVLSLLSATLLLKKRVFFHKVNIITGSSHKS